MTPHLGAGPLERRCALELLDSSCATPVRARGGSQVSRSQVGLFVVPCAATVGKGANRRLRSTTGVRYGAKNDAASFRGLLAQGLGQAANRWLNPTNCRKHKPNVANSARAPKGLNTGRLRPPAESKMTAHPGSAGGRQASPEKGSSAKSGQRPSDDCAAARMSLELMCNRIR